MGRGHNHDGPETASDRSLWWALALGFTGALWIDPLVAVAIALWVLPASADAPHEHDHYGRTSPSAMCRSRGPEEFRTL